MRKSLPVEEDERIAATVDSSKGQVNTITYLSSLLMTNADKSRPEIEHQ